MERWHRTPPIAAARASAGKRLDFPLAALASPWAAQVMHMQPVGKMGGGDPGLEALENGASENMPGSDFHPVDVQLVGEEALVGGTLTIMGHGACLWRESKAQRAILGDRTDNRPEVCVQLDFSSTRLIQVRGNIVMAGQDSLVFKSAAEADRAASLFAALPKTPAAMLSSRRRRSLDLESAVKDLAKDLQPLPLESFSPPASSAASRSPAGSKNSPRDPLQQRRNAVAMSPDNADRLREHVREFVKSSSGHALASIRAFAPEYPLEPPMAPTSSPPKMLPPSRDQLKQLVPIVTLMTQHSQQSKQRIAQATSVVALSPNPRQGRMHLEYAEAEGGARVSPSEYERRYRATQLSSNTAKSTQGLQDNNKQAEIKKRLVALEQELHRKFEEALACYMAQKAELLSQA